MNFCLRLVIVLTFYGGCSLSVGADQRPNILWLTSEDNGPQLGCYGDSYAVTPNIDSLAAKSLRYRHCWSNAPVCAPARTTIISGMYATSLGAEHMRSEVRIPSNMRMYPQVLREAGYYCTNHSKTDYNFTSDEVGWHASGGKAHWRNRPDSETPFFAVFNFGASHESQIRARPHQLKHDPDMAPLPAYHPDTPEVRHDWAQYYDKMTQMDAEVGRVLEQLDKDGLTDSTIVFYYGDHGSGMPRSKRWPFDSGLRVPLILHVPQKWNVLAPKDYIVGGESNRLVSFVDLAPTVISLAGIKPPDLMQGIPFAGVFPGLPKTYLFGFRGRMDERIDMVRSCTDGRYVYMRHFYPERPYLKHVDFMFQTPTTQVWKRLFDEGKLNQAQAKFWKQKPVEELFDLEMDPDEVINLAERPEHAARTAAMRIEVANWMTSTRDLGLLPEAELHRLAGDMAPYTYAATKIDFSRLTRLAFDAMDTKDGSSIEDLDDLTNDADSIVRYWAIRGLAIRPSDSGGLRDQALRHASDDESPSVAIASCDGMLASNDALVRDVAIQRLMELANVDRVGHYAAMEALNVLDMHADLDVEARARLAELPRQVKRPPPRVGKYVGRLLDHMRE